MNYPGGKGATYRNIINQMPPHQVYIETHIGGGSVMAAKRAAALNIGIDLNPISLAVTGNAIQPGSTIINGVAEVSSKIAMLAASIANNGGAAASPQYLFVCGDAIEFLSQYPFTGKEFVYLDPPYLMETRRTKRPLYQFEYSDEDHEQLLSCIIDLDCFIAISGYESDLYKDMLCHWRAIQFNSPLHTGETATEWLWMNYNEPKALHDYQYLGNDFRERERIKKKYTRWVNRLKNMNPQESRTILWAIRESGIMVQPRHIKR
jgi:DNA adenine methylase